MPRKVKAILIGLAALGVCAWVLGYAVYRGMYESWAFAEYQVTIHNTTNLPIQLFVELQHAQPEGKRVPPDQLLVKSWHDLQPGEWVVYSDGPGGGLDRLMLSYNQTPLAIESIKIIADEPGMKRWSLLGVKEAYRHQLTKMPRGESTYEIHCAQGDDPVLVRVEHPG